MRGRSFSLFLSGFLGLAAVALAADLPTSIADSFQGSYAGETVVRSLGDASLVVAIDETGEGAATRLFFIDTARPVGTLSLQSSVSRVERSQDALFVTLPKEHRAFSFSLAVEAGHDSEGSGPARQKSAASPRLEVTRYEGVRAIREYHGNLSRLLVPNVTLSAIGAKGLQAFTEAIDYPDLGGDGGGSGCAKSCNISCSDGSSCSASCGSNQCGSCSCTFGASCSCS